MNAYEACSYPWKADERRKSIEVLRVGPFVLHASDDKWWCPGAAKAVACRSREGAKVKALLWAREQVRLALRMLDDKIDETAKPERELPAPEPIEPLLPGVTL